MAKMRTTDDLKNRIKISNPNNEKINFLQEDIIHNSENFYNEILNLSLFNEDKYFFISNGMIKYYLL